VAWGRDRDNEAHLRELLRELRVRRSRPLFVKLPPFRTDVEREVVLSLARIAHGEGADGLTCSNSLPVTEPRLASGAGGLSGSELLAGTLENVRAVRDATDGGLPINACGGVAGAADAVACLEAGATTIQLYAGLVYRGPRIVGELTAGLAAVARERPGGVAAMTRGEVAPGEGGLLAD
jgi:dihydroorotate dehydrogenase